MDTLTSSSGFLIPAPLPQPGHSLPGQFWPWGWRRGMGVSSTPSASPPRLEAALSYLEGCHRLGT